MLLPTDYIALFGLAGFTVLLCLAVTDKRRWLNAIGYCVAIAVFTLHILDSFLDYLWAWVWPHPSVVVMMLAAVWGPLIAILVGLSRYIRQPRDRRALRLICVIVGIIAVYSIGYQLIDPGASEANTWDGDTLLQSTSSTCVAAACCTYLRTEGVGLTERAAIRSGLINNDGGTQVQAWRILRQNLGPEYIVRISPLPLQEMAATGQWYVVSTRLGALTGHCVCVRGAEDEYGPHIIVRDPLVGEYEKSLEEFGRAWYGVAVWGERRT